MSAEQLEPMLINTGDVRHPTPVSQAILDGYAPDSELYNYESFPTIDETELRSFVGADYPTIFSAVTKKFLGSAIPQDVLRTTSEEAYSPDKFDFDTDGNLRITTLPSGIHVVGLSDGPTGSFKDMAMQPLVRWMNYLQQQKGDPLTIMLVTSGDTGPAALEAALALKDTEIINLLPEAGVSAMQWAQMTRYAKRPGVHVLEVAGDFSYLNNLHMKADELYDLSATNSVNIGRIIAQTSYYVASYVKAIEMEGKQIGDPVDVSIPSGNFGNALSAIIARKMGVPIRNIIVATNENNTLDKVFRQGVFENTPFTHTDSSAQDVRMPSNIWRYFGMLYGNDPEKGALVYKELKEVGSIAIHSVGVVDYSVLDGITSATITASDRAQTIKDVYAASDEANRTFIDPHTANGLAAIQKLKAHDPDVPMLTMETAKSFKFDQAMMRILGIKQPRPARFKGLERSQKGKQLTRIKDEPELLEYLRLYTNAKRK
jgi:threonine synthase